MDYVKGYRPGPHDRRDLDQHPLAGATHPTASTDGSVLYVVCACGRRRRVTGADWGLERARREAAQGKEPPHV
jgi:hypothetical protein